MAMPQLNELIGELEQTVIRQHDGGEILDIVPYMSDRGYRAFVSEVAYQKYIGPYNDTALQNMPLSKGNIGDYLVERLNCAYEGYLEEQNNYIERHKIAFQEQ